MVHFSSWQTPESFQKYSRLVTFLGIPRDQHENAYHLALTCSVSEASSLHAFFLLCNETCSRQPPAFGILWARDKHHSLHAETAGNTCQAGGICSIIAWANLCICAANTHLARNWDCVSVSLRQTFQSLSGHWEVTLLDSREERMW